jgi:thiosulfate/3-mercaptopyruvate sulfurtransferase
MTDAFGPLVSAGWLAQHLDDVALVDVRYYLDGRSGRDAYEQSHLPSAVWMDLEAVLADPPSPTRGRHPLPTPERFADGLSRAGIGAGTPVVAYDDQGGPFASRLVWLLRTLGHPAALLDGGLQAWPGALATGAYDRALASFPQQPWPPEHFAKMDEIPRVGLLLDARAPERYRGEVEPLDPRAGHIPGARNAPWPANLDATGRFRPAVELRQQFTGLETPVVYCGSGVTACHTLLALEVAGVQGARLYPGSWSQWCSDPDRPAELGDPAR